MGISLDLPDVDFLQKILKYDENEGKLYWLPRNKDTYSGNLVMWNKKWANKEAGHYGYKSNLIMIDNSRYYLQSIIWSIYYKKHPKNTPIYKNGNKKDNKINNLSDDVPDHVRILFKTKKLPSLENLNKMYRYDTNLNKMYKKQYSKKTGNLIKEKEIDVSLNKSINIEKSMYRISRVIWALVYNEDPHGFVIDHISGDDTDNRINNLRKITHQENMKNNKTYRQKIE